ncbi:MAG: ATP phosphoribosyltransferase regulatory subunit [Burkholderia sp.]|nr:ATP phosphoribosyltransferase regulatory subunit [Burkholderia sp.]
MSIWLLPENIADVLPDEARKIEELRRRLLDHFRSYGYEIVMPPLLEYLESLLTSCGKDLRLSTFKLVDQMSGRMLGLRADITPQIARIDAHLLNRQGVTRLCYAGNVLHTRPRGLRVTREQIQIGAEIYGHAGLEADIEIQQLMLDSLHLAGLSEIRLDLCHSGCLAALFELDYRSANRSEALYDALSSKDASLISELTSDLDVKARDALRLLPSLYGDIAVLDVARVQLPMLPGITRALDDLTQLAKQVKDAEVAIDLADLRGYAYHSGVMFSAYVDGVPNAVARGGRYDHVGKSYGRERPATGFSLDLREIAPISSIAPCNGVILAPWSLDDGLCVTIANLRESGEIVIQVLPGHDHSLNEFSCNRTLIKQDGVWLIKSLEN